MRRWQNAFARPVVDRSISDAKQFGERFASPALLTLVLVHGDSLSQQVLLKAVHPSYPEKLDLERVEKVDRQPLQAHVFRKGNGRDMEGLK